MLDPDFHLDQQSLTRVVPVNTLIKGLSLYHGQKVLDISVTPRGEAAWQIEGLVQGTEPEPYAQSVRVVLNAGRQLMQWQARCSCPVGVDCKHAAALTIKAAVRSKGMSTRAAGTPAAAHPAALDPQARQRALREAERAVAEQRATRWLQGFGELAVAASPPSPAKPADAYVYLLVAETWGRKRRLALRVATSYRLVKGGWAKPKKASALSHAGMPAFDRAGTDDRDLLRLIKGLGSEQRYGGYTDHLQGLLQGSLGALALALAGQTGRLFVADAGNNLVPLALGEPRDLHWHWTESEAVDDAGPAWTLHHRLDDAQAEVFANQPPLYLDTRLRVCGPVRAPGVPPEHLVPLLDAPPLPQAVIAQHEPALLRRLAGVPLPPAIQAPRAVQGVAPAAHLRIGAVAAGEVAGRGLLCARLKFDYAGACGFWPDEPAVVLLPDPQQADGRVLVQRDLAAETLFVDRLARLGLASDAQGRCHMPGAAGQLRWLQWLDADWAALREAGFAVTADPALADWIARGDALQVALTPPADTGDDAASPWFDLSLGLDIDGVRHDILPWLPALLAQLQPGTGRGDADGVGLPPFVFWRQPDGRFLRVATDALRPWIGALLDLVGERPQDLGAGSLRLSRLEAMRLGAALGPELSWRGAQALQDMVRQLQGRSELPAVAPPPTLQATLRPYQQAGLDWLQFLRRQGLAGILADDMGLGKTLQTLAHIQLEKDGGRLDAPALIVAPVSLMGNWQREANRFCPDLRTLVLHGPERHAAVPAIARHDVVIAPYSLLHRDREGWLQRRWHLVVLDEAQNIKNASSHAAQVAGQLDARHRLCLSGTPMENHLGELWSLFHFLMPGFLGSAARFRALFRTPIEKLGDQERLSQLRRRVTPFMLRRTKDRVASELPPKVETVLRAELSGPQADLYETIRLTTERAVREALARKGLAQSQITVLDALLKLRQVCCDPRLVPLPAARAIAASAKLEQLMEMLPEMLAEGRRVLLFSQFTSMLELIEAELAARRLAWVKLTGQSKNRDALIARFTGGEVPLFLISLKAGGVGLNLPQADTVIHYDPWWNPAVENQATDRAHRIGQTRSVWVVKLVARGTIEERILALQERKAALADSMYSGAQARRQPLFTEDDLQELLQPLGD